MTATGVRSNSVEPGRKPQVGLRYARQNVPGRQPYKFHSVTDELPNPAPGPAPAPHSQPFLPFVPPPMPNQTVNDLVTSKGKEKSTQVK
jgi:hypothetical protein